MPDDYVKDHVIIYTRILRSAEKFVRYMVLSFCQFKKTRRNKLCIKLLIFNIDFCQEYQPSKSEESVRIH